MAKTVLITPRDPLIFRDGRPFDSGLTTRLHAHTWPFPSVTAGALRTHARKMSEYLDKNKLNGIDIRGPLLYRSNGSNKGLYVPAPLDAVLVEQPANKQTLHRLHLEVLSSEEGTDLPFAMQPLLLPKGVSKPVSLNKYAWWPLPLMEKWLLDADKVDAAMLEQECLGELPLDERTHVCIDPNTGAADPMKLFSTRGVDFMLGKKKGVDRSLPLQIALRVDRAEGVDFSSGPIPLGAERRVAELSDASNVREEIWNCQDEIKKILSSSDQIKLQLATPAIFNKGWHPDWLTEIGEEGKLTGEIPDSGGVKVELVAAAIGRPIPISGYAYGYKDGVKRIKATKKMVPAGSVYFFNVLQGNTAAFADDNLWLRPVCGQSYFHPQPNKAKRGLGADGFGLALWGTWKP